MTLAALEELVASRKEVAKKSPVPVLAALPVEDLERLVLIAKHVKAYFTYGGTADFRTVMEMLRLLEAK